MSSKKYHSGKFSVVKVDDASIGKPGMIQVAKSALEVAAEELRRAVEPKGVQPAR